MIIYIVWSLASVGNSINIQGIWNVCFFKLNDFDGINGSLDKSYSDHLKVESHLTQKSQISRKNCGSWSVRKSKNVNFLTLPYLHSVNLTRVPLTFTHPSLQHVISTLPHKGHPCLAPQNPSLEHKSVTWTQIRHLNTNPSLEHKSVTSIRNFHTSRIPLVTNLCWSDGCVEVGGNHLMI